MQRMDQFAIHDRRNAVPDGFTALNFLLDALQLREQQQHTWIVDVNKTTTIPKAAMNAAPVLTPRAGHVSLSWRIQ